YGFSYINPLVNILDAFIPTNIRLVAPMSFNFQELYASWGFSQVAESYANFGVIGVMLYHFIIGFLIRNMEMKQLRGSDLALWGSIVAILINVTRNRFALFFGQAFILLLIITLIRFLSSKNVKFKIR
ncbi:MAG: O-antigen polysaccharide polymerase Wzy, partial [Culicoidibacterales bacterium]